MNNVVLVFISALAIVYVDMILYVAIKFKSQNLKAKTFIANISTPFAIYVANVRTFWKLFGDYKNDRIIIRAIKSVLYGIVFFNLAVAVSARMIVGFYANNMQSVKNMASTSKKSKNRNINDAISDIVTRLPLRELTQNNHTGYDLAVA